MRNNKNKTSRATVSKGYRLKPSTHKLIRELQRSLSATQEQVISKALRLFRRDKLNIDKTKIL